VSSLSPEAALAAGYALFLLATAAVLDLLARHAHRRSDRYRTAGFVYHEHLDAWECPEGQHLWPAQHDHQRRLVRYRGKAHVCNACAVKRNCTDSDEGREVLRSLEPWPRSEAGRFHRAIGLALILLAALVAAIPLVWHHDPLELLVLGVVLVLTTLAGLRLRAIRPTPS
jgi:hypothetical protein